MGSRMVFPRRRPYSSFTGTLEYVEMIAGSRSTAALTIRATIARALPTHTLAGIPSDAGIEQVQGYAEDERLQAGGEEPDVRVVRSLQHRQEHEGAQHGQDKGSRATGATDQEWSNSST